MTDIMKRKFIALKISGKNYTTWVLDAEIHLDAMGLGDAIKDRNKASTQDYAKTLIFLRHYLDEGITSKLKLSADNITDYDMLEKTFTTFLASNMVLQQLYREKGFKKYSELISLLLVAERNNDLLMRNHENRPTGSTPFPKVDEMYSHYAKREKWKGKDEKPKAKGSEIECYQCSKKRHWANIYRIPKYLVEIYQVPLKNKGLEANFVYDNEFDITHLDVADFFEHPDGKINHLISDGSVVKDD
ncbi:uncharacterized protein [Nicotiana tomentosiformis]|uniref:uncharacterized protein n=1 Tax=Nicotiana tomentosiformis TaxID=4098 RepID=UPI00388C7CA4